MQDAITENVILLFPFAMALAATGFIQLSDDFDMTMKVGVGLWMLASIILMVLPFIVPTATIHWLIPIGMQFVICFGIAWYVQFG